MKLAIVNIDRINPQFALCTLSDGSHYSIRGSEFCVDSQILKYQSDGGITVNQQSFTTNEGSEANEKPYLPPSLDFSDDAVTNQSAKVDNASRGPDSVYVMPTMDFSDRLVKR